MIVLHVGLKKAGSSTLQKFLSDNRRELSRQYFEFCGIGLNRNSHYRIARQVVNRGKPDATLRDTSLLDQIADYWRQSPSSTLILSSETFEDTTPDGIAHLKEKLGGARLGERIRILMVLRDLVELIPSSYAQKIKHGYNTYDFDEFFAIRMTKERVDYFSTAARWAAGFGWENMIVPVLDARHLHNGNLIDEVFHRLRAFASTPDISAIDRGVVRNQRPGWRVAEAVRALYAGTDGLPAEHAIHKARMQSRDTKRLGKLAVEVGEAIGWHRDKGRYLTRDQAEACSMLYEAAVASLNAHLVDKLPPAPADLDARSFVEREFLPSAEAIPRADLVAFYDRLAECWFERRDKNSSKFDTGAGRSAGGAPEDYSPDRRAGAANTPLSLYA
jgi:hypothetical protein